METRLHSLLSLVMVRNILLINKCVSSTRLMGERDLLDECFSWFNPSLSPAGGTWDDHSLRHVHVGSRGVNVQTSDIGREGK